MATFPPLTQASFPSTNVQNAEFDFSKSNVTPSSDFEMLPLELMQKMGSLLEIVELGRLSSTSKSLHNLTTQISWPHPLSSVGLLSKSVIKKEFLLVREKCLDIFIKIFGVKCLIRTKVEEFFPENVNFCQNPHLQAILEEHKLIRRSDFSAFMFGCSIDQVQEAVVISKKTSDSLELRFLRSGTLHSFHTVRINFKKEALLKNFFKSGSWSFSTTLCDEPIHLQLPPDVVALCNAQVV